MLNSTIRNSTRFPNIKDLQHILLKSEPQDYFSFQKILFLSPPPTSCCIRHNNTQICNMQSKLGTCLSQENSILKEHSTNERIFRATLSSQIIENYLPHMLASGLPHTSV